MHLMRHGKFRLPGRKLPAYKWQNLLCFYVQPQPFLEMNGLKDKSPIHKQVQISSWALNHHMLRKITQRHFISYRNTQGDSKS